MTDPNNDEPRDRSYENSLYPEDQKKVDEFLAKGVNSVDRKPFRPMLMMGLLVITVTLLSVLSLWLADISGVH